MTEVKRLVKATQQRDEYENMNQDKDGPDFQ